jgi:acyl-CoA synthetase (AMP-forming)/AMP-acid ligase II
MHNISETLFARALRAPQQVALHYPTKAGYASITFEQLAQRVNRLASGMHGFGIRPGTRVSLMVGPGLDFLTAMFALFRIAAVPVLIDPGIARSALRQCLREAEPEVFIGIALAQWARRVLGWGRESVKRSVLVGRGDPFCDRSLAQLEAAGDADFIPPEHASDELAAILFTSGSTGIPKGVCYSHANFLAQVEMLKQALGLPEGAINLPTFPPFALFDPALGLTSVIPRMDPRHPARAKASDLTQLIEAFQVHSMFGSPALLKPLLVDWRARGKAPASLKCVFSAGAPVAPSLVATTRALLADEARMFTPYGATEALPVALVESRALLGEVQLLSERGAGVCVGRVVPPNHVRIIETSDVEIASLEQAVLCPDLQIGEITVRGPSVTLAYLARPKQTALAKIREGGEVVHRMGDLGYFDVEGKLWFVGRKSERVQTSERLYYPECVEQIVRTHPGVRLAALVGVGVRPKQEPVLIVELEPRFVAKEPWFAGLRSLLAEHAASAGITQILLHPKLPVDIRHNAKIGREALARWATEKLSRWPTLGVSQIP